MPSMISTQALGLTNLVGQDIEPLSPIPTGHKICSFSHYLIENFNVVAVPGPRSPQGMYAEWSPQKGKGFHKPERDHLFPSFLMGKSSWIYRPFSFNPMMSASSPLSA